MRDAFCTQTTETWLARLQAADIIAERILSPADWLHDEHVEATKAFVCQDTPDVGQVFTARTPGTSGVAEDAMRPAPRIGQDSREVLMGAGYGSEVVEDLISEGVVRAST
jgi:crotonobetainyl-CoA:carnitine CoA-transferase CaiB-like acyl-CoA transferase